MAEPVHGHGPIEGGKALDWSAFLTMFFPNRRRHDLEALSAYAAYKSRLEQEPSALREERARPPSLEATRVRVAAPSSAALTWESEGGAAAERDED